MCQWLKWCVSLSLLLVRKFWVRQSRADIQTPQYTSVSGSSNFPRQLPRMRPLTMWFKLAAGIPDITSVFHTQRYRKKEKSVAILFPWDFSGHSILHCILYTTLYALYYMINDGYNELQRKFASFKRGWGIQPFSWIDVSSCLSRFCY